MRLIPRNTKVKTSFYKGITLLDIILGLIALALVALAVSSNLTYKYLIALGIACVFIPLFIPIGDERIYMCAFNICKHLFLRKKYLHNGKDATNVQSIIPYERVDESVIVNKDGSYTGVLEIKPIEFRLLGWDKQNYIIDGVLTNALNCISVGQQAAIVKIDKLLNMDKHLQLDLDRIVALADARESDALTEDEYIARVDIIEDRMALVDTLNSEKEIKYSTYYIAVTDKSKVSLKSTLSSMKRTLNAGSIEANVLDTNQLEEFLITSKQCKSNDEKTVCPDEVTFRLTSTLQDNLCISHFVITGYPLKVPNAWGEELFDIPNTKVVMKLTPVEKSKALKRIDNAIMELTAQVKGKTSKIIDKTTHIETLSNLLVRLQNDNETLFDTTLIITAYDTKGKSDVRKKVKSKIRELGFVATDMFGRQQDAYLTSELSFYDSVKISRGIQASSIAACFPFVSNAVEDNNGILLGENKLPAFVDFFKRNAEYVNLRTLRLAMRRFLFSTPKANT